jgi:hypothetical protein
LTFRVIKSVRDRGLFWKLHPLLTGPLIHEVKSKIE